MPQNRISHLSAPVDDEIPRNRSFGRAFAHFLFSNLGLVIVVVGYSIGGAFLFILLEQYIELQNCQQGSLSENMSVSNLSETMYNYVVITDDNITLMYDQMEEYLANYSSDIYDRKNLYRYTGQDCSTTSGWTFPSALLFTITVITTIGYGQITPTSWEGQITCICYALIGIPIFLLCLSNISSVLGDIFRFMYSALLHCCCCCCRIYGRSRQRRKRKGGMRKKIETNGLEYTGSTSMDPSWPDANHPRGRKQSDAEEEDDEDDFDDDNDGFGDVWDRMESRVPFGAVILIIVGYLYLGSLMFSHFEGWTMIESVYFCYITLATVGFGDYVPGITSGSMAGLRFLLASLYILFGLAILAMCFDLIKEGIVDKFRWFAYKFGIVADDADELDEDPTKYAAFEYDTSEPQQQQQQQRLSVKRAVTGIRSKSSNSIGEPPGYEVDEAPDGQWLKNIKDKAEPPTVGGGKRAIKPINAKR